MRVLHCIPNMAGGGAERQLALLATAQQRAGFAVGVALLAAGPNSARLEASGAQIFRIGASGNHDPRIAAALVALMRRHRPDVVQTWLPQMDVLGGLAAWLTRSPWVLSERCASEAYRGRITDRLLRATAGRAADAIVANSADGLAYWRGRSAARAVLEVVPNMLPLDEIGVAEPLDLPAAGLATDGPLLLNVGRLAPQKNLPLLLHALAALSAERPFSAIFCGEGPLAGELAALAQRLGLASRVTFAGYRSDIWRLMKRADLLVNLSTFEGQPNAVIEAMACGCPVVASDIGAHRALLGGDLGLLVDAQSPAAVAAALHSVLANRGAARARAARAQTAAAAFGPDAAVRAYDAVYRRITRAPAVPTRASESGPITPVEEGQHVRH